MELAMQIIPNDKTVGRDTVKGLKDFNSQSLATQAKKAEQLVSMMPTIKKTFDFLSDHLVDLPTENDALKSRRVR